MTRKRLLIILLGLLICSLAYAFWNIPRQQRVTPGLPAAKVGPDNPKHRRSDAAPGTAEDGLRVHLELLTRVEEKVPARRRDLFAPLFTVRLPPPPAPPPPAPAMPALGGIAAGGHSPTASAIAGTGALHLSRFSSEGGGKDGFPFIGRGDLRGEKRGPLRP